MIGVCGGVYNDTCTGYVFWGFLSPGGCVGIVLGWRWARSVGRFGGEVGGVIWAGDMSVGIKVRRKDFSVV